MHVVILGCGRVGSALAHTLEAAGCTVAIVDQDADAFRRLQPGFRGRTVVGVGFDRDTLREAGIETADAFAAVSSGDNSNILTARVARETFGVGNVVARIYDPRRAEVYERLGIPTVATVRWTAEQIVRRLLPTAGQSDWADPSGAVVLTELGLHPGWVGARLRDVEAQTNCRVACLTRRGEGSIPSRDTMVQEGDRLHVAVARADLPAVEQALAHGPRSAA